MNLVYVYALVDEPARTLRISRHRISFLDFGGVHAAVEKRASSPELSEISLQAQHAIVARLADRFDAILPARFGSLVETSELARIIDMRRRLLEGALGHVRGQAQMTVRLFGPEPRVRRAAATPLTGAAYLAGRQAAARTALPRAAQRVRDTVKPVVTAECIGQGRGQIRVVLHHLLPRGRASEYRKLVQEAARGAGVERVAVSGPFAPFAFVPDIWS
jgi:hypothetical protein